MSDSKSVLIIPVKGEVGGILQYKNGARSRIKLMPSTDGKAYECSVADAKFLESTGDFKIKKTSKAAKEKTPGGDA